MFGSKGRQLKRTQAELEETQAERDAAMAERDRALTEQELAEAEIESLRRKYEPPVTIRRVVSSGFESNRRKH